MPIYPNIPVCIILSVIQFLLNRIGGPGLPPLSGQRKWGGGGGAWSGKGLEKELALLFKRHFFFWRGWGAEQSRRCFLLGSDHLCFLNGWQGRNEVITHVFGPK